MDSVKGGFHRVKHGGRSIKNDVREKTVGYVLAGLGVVAGLAWNEAINGLIEYLFPLSRSGVFAKFLYAFLMTLMLVLVTSYLMRMIQKDQDNELKK